ncbi:MAG: sterol desaturase family protein [Candidatus Omnitrophica bacterium]|nr:sterol desaturase family protein [Candidatus Omnitrophota bacterium]
MRQDLFITQLTALGLCLWLESVAPFFMDRPQRVRHVARNITIGLINGAVLALGLSGLVFQAAEWATAHHSGLLNRVTLPPPAERWIGFILFDLWMYLWHRANHRLPILWRFHRVHHTDDALDASSAVRFHVGEMVLSSLLRLAVVPVLGIRFQDLVLYEMVLQPVILFHHSNIAVPDGLDRGIRFMVVSPNMHRVHHSDIPQETNSNYASVFSFWDRLFGTYRRRETSSIRFGLKEFQDPRWQSVGGMLVNPLAR